MYKPFSQACENNKEPILQVLKNYLDDKTSVLEIGSGTGQHAVHFAKIFPQLIWQSSDRAEYISGIQAWLKSAELNNTPTPIVLDVNDNWAIETVPAIFSANTVHIMSWQEVEKLFIHINNILAKNGLLFLYGPFNYDGAYTSESNANFDIWLKHRDPLSGIRDFEAVNDLAIKARLSLLADHKMPANNRLLVWKKSDTD